MGIRQGSWLKSFTLRDRDQKPLALPQPYSQFYVNRVVDEREPKGYGKREGI